MTGYLNDLIDKMNFDKGKNFNLLVKNGVIDLQYVVDEVIYNGEGYQYLFLAKYGNLSEEDKQLLAVDLVKKKATVIMYNYAKDVEGAPIPVLEDAIIKDGNPYYIYLFAKDVKGADINRLEEAIIKIGNPEYIYLFARDIEYANTELLLDALIKTKDARFLLAYARDIIGAPLEKIEEALIEIGNTAYYNQFIKFKKEKQDIDYEILNNLLKNNDIEQIIDYRSKYAYLFEDVKFKRLIREKKN